jgi:hypothetical protein
VRSGRCLSATLLTLLPPRRDNCQLVRTVIDTCLRKILIEQDVPGAVAFAKKTIADLLQNKVRLRHESSPVLTPSARWTSPT